ncbi:MAG: PEGA domain-containing protein [Acidobacteriota bacterium]
MTCKLVVAFSACLAATVPMSTATGLRAAADSIPAAAFDGSVMRPAAGDRGPGQQKTDVDDRLRILFGRAESLFRSLAPEQSLKPLSRVIDTLEPAAEAGTIRSEGRLLLIRALAYRAQVYLEGNERRAADDDLKRLISLYPGVSIEGYRLSEALLGRFKRARSRLVGNLEISVVPTDARVRVDGERIELETPQGHPVLVGEHEVVADLPGFTEVVRQVKVGAGHSERLELTLHRVSAVLKLMTSPPGATVVVDGKVVGETSGVAPVDFHPSGAAASIPHDEFSSALTIEGLMPGSHELEIFREGYRGFRATVPISDLGDFDLGAVVLERSEGLLLLRQLPDGAEVRVDGKRVQPEPPSSGGGDSGADALLSTTHRLALPPGQHLVTVDNGAAGVFESEVSLAENRNQMLTVRLKPGLTFLGVLGGDEMAANALQGTLADAFLSLGDWSLLDRSQQGAGLLDTVGISARELRRLAAAEASEPVNWARVQSATGKALPGSLFLLAVLSSDDFARTADIWVWPAAPGPARPERFRLALGSREDLATMTAKLDESVSFRRNWFGARVIDTDAATAPVVAAVIADSPAARAGLQVGEEVLSVGGNIVGTAANTLAWLDTFAPGAKVVLQVRGAAGERTLEMSLESTYAVIAPTDPERLYGVVWALAAAAEGRLDAPVPSWVLELDEAAVLLQAKAWRAAADLLATIEAPVGAGLGQPMADYWLGVALSHLGEVGGARAAYERVASVPGARYLHNDGPLLAPRARVRLAALKGTTGS